MFKLARFLNDKTWLEKVVRNPDTGRKVKVKSLPKQYKQMYNPAAHLKHKLNKQKLLHLKEHAKTLKKTWLPSEEKPQHPKLDKLNTKIESLSGKIESFKQKKKQFKEHKDKSLQQQKIEDKTKNKIDKFKKTINNLKKHHQLLKDKVTVLKDRNPQHPKIKILKNKMKQTKDSIKDLKSRKPVLPVSEPRKQVVKSKDRMPSSELVTAPTSDPLTKVKDNYGNTILHSKASKGDKTVLDHPMVSKLKNQHGRTPLHDLASTGNVDVLKHPDVSKIEDKRGHTPLHSLAAVGKREVLTHPDVTKGNSAGFTALHALGQAGVLPNHPEADHLKDKFGKTPKDYFNQSFGDTEEDDDDEDQASGIKYFGSRIINFIKKY